jgi:hypothetical protein
VGLAKATGGLGLRFGLALGVVGVLFAAALSTLDLACAFGFGGVRGGSAMRRSGLDLRGLVRGFGGGLGGGAVGGCVLACCSNSRHVFVTMRCSNANCCCGVQISNSLTLSPFLLFS